jgi:uncharacterized membrane protein YtjA (UPF0391 family)
MIGAFPLLETIAILALLVWLAGVISSYTVEGVIHILLVIAVIMFLVSLTQGRKS